MQQKTNLLWKIYFFFFLLVFAWILNFSGIFLNESTVNQYYKILIIFKKSYWIAYGLHWAAITVEMISLIPLFLFVFHKKFLDPILWQLLFAARILLFIFSYTYDKMWIRSSFYTNPLLTTVTLGPFAMLILLSLIAHLLYAFYPQKLFPKA